MQPSISHTVAECVANFLVAHQVDRVFGLQGAHIQPIWDHLAQQRVRIIDVRHESAAVHMAHAHAVLTGHIGVAIATAGPGVTNCVTAIANADLERAPVLLIGGCAPRPQDDLGPLQGTPHTAVMQPVTRLSRTLQVADNIPRDLDQAISIALGDGNSPGPVYIEIPPDVLREQLRPNLVLEEYLRPKPLRVLHPDRHDIARAAEVIAEAKRPLVITGRGARGAESELVHFLNATGALYLDTQESRGLVPPNHPSVVGAMRGKAMRQADLLIIVGRKLDYQLAYGSPAVFPNARFVRIGDCWEELWKNRRGEVEIFAHPGIALSELVAAGVRSSPQADREWTTKLRDDHVQRTREYAEGLKTAPSGRDGFMHPNRIFAALSDLLGPDAITVADGGDILSFARMGLNSGTYLDSGAFGCLGVGIAYGIAASLALPKRQVVVVSGDGAFGINAMEIDTAKRHNAGAVFIIANNGAWNIERIDQELNYEGRVVGTTLQYADHAMMARAFGLHGQRVSDPAKLHRAIQEALANAPALVDVVVTRDAMSSDAGKGLGMVPDYQALKAWDDAERGRRA
jgi:acetolactate synthase-1/2/3 large subunit